MWTTQKSQVLVVMRSEEELCLTVIKIMIIIIFIIRIIFIRKNNRSRPPTHQNIKCISRFSMLSRLKDVFTVWASQKRRMTGKTRSILTLTVLSSFCYPALFKLTCIRRFIDMHLRLKSPSLLWPTWSSESSGYYANHTLQVSTWPARQRLCQSLRDRF